MKYMILLLALVLIPACGGSTNGSGSGTVVQVNYDTPIIVDTFQPLVGSSDSQAIMDIFNKDLNNDGVDEVIIAGRETQPSDLSGWQSFNVQIFGWNNGSFSNETSDWFTGTDNIIIGTEPDVHFGDFNGDNRTDIVMAASTDMSVLKGDTLVYFNNNDGAFTKQSLTSNTAWQHDMVVYDFNNDGYDDFMTSDYGSKTAMYFGSAAGIFTEYLSNNVGYSASGIAVADFIPGGNAEVVLTDNGPDGNNDITLYSWSVSLTELTLALTKISSLPGTLFTAEQIAAETSEPYLSSGAHAIRAEAVDFDSDGDKDVLIFDRLSNASIVQFLRNDNAGTFVDVTGTMSVNYDGSAGGVNYQPILRDFNGDGLTDLFSSGGLTQVMLQSSDGKFVSRFSGIFSDFTDDISASYDSLHLRGTQPMQVVRGPNSEYYLVGMVQKDNYVNGTVDNVTATVYIAKLGVMPSQSSLTSEELLSAEWPYLH